MKKKLFTLLALTLATWGGVSAQTWTASSTKPDAEAELMDNDLVTVKTTFATTNGGWARTLDNITFTHYIEVRSKAPSTEHPEGEADGTRTTLVVTAKEDVNVTFYFRRQEGSDGYKKDDNKDMQCYVQNGVAIPESEESEPYEYIASGDNSQAYGIVKKTYKFTKGGVYTIYRVSSTLQVGGFVVALPPSDPATAPTFNPDGGDVVAYSKIALSSDGTVYYQWQDAETTLTKDSEGWNIGSTVEVPNVGGTKYLYAYATNGEGLESEVVSKAFNITEVTLTAVTNKTWDFSTWETQEFTSMYYYDNLIIYAKDGSSETVNIKNNRLELGGSGKADYRNIQFMVAPKSRITIKTLSNAASGRGLNIDLNTFGNNIGKVESPTSAITYSIDYTGNEDATLIVYGYGGGVNITSIAVEPLPTDTKEVTSHGWATYIPESNALFAEDEAYIVTGVDLATGRVTIENVTEVPANTPVLLKDEGTKTITLTTATIEAPENNMLEVGDGNDNEDKVAYVLAKDGNNAGFKKWTGSISDLNGRTILWLDSAIANARGFFGLDGDDTTGIQNIKVSTENNTYYDLQGRRVANPTNGLYIVNGKKVIIK